MRKLETDISIFKERRNKLAQRMGGAALVLPAHPNFIRNHDVHHHYRQDSNLQYLTGFTEPDSILLFRPGKTPETVMFVHPKDPSKETWEGFLYGPQLTKQEFGIDEAYEFSKFEEVATQLLADSDKVYYRLFHNHEFDKVMEKTLKGIYQLRRRTNRGILPIEDSYPLIGEQRLFKSDWEIETMRKSCQITAEAHVEVMKATKPGVNERALYGTFLKEIMVRGADREGYRGIFAAGNNATTLHYVFNDQVLKNGDLFLIDAGGEYKYYSADITRTYPVNGKFNPDQKRIYQKVLDLQKELVEMVVPGTALSDLNKVCIKGLTEIMVDEKLLRGNVDELIKNLDYRKYYPHGVGHWLGMDVHDAGATEVRGESRRLEVGMVMTIEPGIYIPGDDTSAPEGLRGIGIRIEDDVLCTNGAPEVFTKGAPKEIAEMEALIGKA
jgi:Xaa-Pro aminopeptidase